VTTKIAILGAPGIGTRGIWEKYCRTSLNACDATLSVAWIEREITVKNARVSMVCWSVDLQKHFMGMLPVAC
jgi:hypothetical protein